MILKPSDVEIQGPKGSIGEKVNGILKSKIILEVHYLFANQICRISWHFSPKIFWSNKVLQPLDTTLL